MLREVGAAVLDEFQSLFSWNLPSDVMGNAHVGGDAISFNPCFLGTCPRMEGHRRYGGHLTSFNPCFLGTCPRMVHAVLIGMTTVRVSILVFLELALGSSLSPDLIANTASFNPCFLGTCPRILVCLFSSTSRRPSFNPCFLGTCPRISGQC